MVPRNHPTRRWVCRTWFPSDKHVPSHRVRYIVFFLFNKFVTAWKFLVHKKEALKRETCRPLLPKRLGQVSFHPTFSRSSHAGSSGSAGAPLLCPSFKRPGTSCLAKEDHRPWSPVVLVGMVGMQGAQMAKLGQSTVLPATGNLQSSKGGEGKGWKSMGTPVCVVGGGASCPNTN